MAPDSLIWIGMNGTAILLGLFAVRKVMQAADRYTVERAERELQEHRADSWRRSFKALERKYYELCETHEAVLARSRRRHLALKQLKLALDRRRPMLEAVPTLLEMRGRLKRGSEMLHERIFLDVNREELAKLLEVAEAAHTDLEQSERRAREATEKRDATT
jgi:hypothetical protein